MYRLPVGCCLGAFLFNSIKILNIILVTIAMDRQSTDILRLLAANVPFLSVRFI